MVEIDKHIREACESLEAFAKEVDEGVFPSQQPGFSDGKGIPKLTQHELANFPRFLAVSLALHLPTTDKTDDLELIIDIPRRVKQLRSQVLSGIFNPGASPVDRQGCFTTYIHTFVGIRVALFGFLDWQLIDDPQILPSPLADRVKEASGRLNELEPQLDGLNRKITAIENAHTYAEMLGNELAKVKAMQDVVSQDVASSKTDVYEVAKIKKQADDIYWLLQAREATINTILAKAEEALRASTTIGLAGAFQERANNLRSLNFVWLTLLIASLGVVGYIGFLRVAELSPLFKGANPELGTVFTQLLLSFASVGAPIWLAWLATKQINQGFKLMEDYSFKSAVARAYEGYRKEAANVDPELSKRLFASALARFEEAPLRWMEKSSPGSPVHEALREFREGLSSVAGSAKAVVTPQKPNASDPTG